MTSHGSEEIFRVMSKKIIIDQSIFLVSFLYYNHSEILFLSVLTDLSQIMSIVQESSSPTNKAGMMHGCEAELNHRRYGLRVQDRESPFNGGSSWVVLLPEVKPIHYQFL